MRSDCTCSQPPLANAAVKRRPVSSSCGPVQAMKPARETKRAGQLMPWLGRVTNSMAPKPPTA